LIVETPALANAAYETDEPEVLVPIGFVKKVGLKPDLTTVGTYESITGTTTLGFIPKAVEISIAGVIGSPVKAHVAVSVVRGEVLLSDKLLSALRIELTDPGKGLWRLRGELKTRKSVRPKIW
jgi:hypothetical protein